ncbi:cytochrome c oxidase subunit 4 [Dactylosporangium roseum]|uniref:Cytochrome c oxidase polypeptide 4 n=1 Tax=Dactylosporangium roseum TaxID=47989 RepID=A0ABY5ZGE0_9ACTN|nr:cytochrome c oxidase subunit 4 [Dactylosporangium roseum]UWZ40018.1 cytochrome c oxidase subunit 4 [Dactylosporangium roseum]
MRAETKLFALVGGLLVVITGAYAYLTHALSGSVERTGTVALGLSCVLCGMSGGYFWLISRRIPPRPEDREDADIADAAGEVGFFSPASYWPLGIGLGAATAALGVALWQLWIAAAGIVGVVAASAAMLFEYYTGANRGAEH